MLHAEQLNLPAAPAKRRDGQYEHQAFSARVELGLGHAGRARLILRQEPTETLLVVIHQASLFAHQQLLTN